MKMGYKRKKTNLGLYQSKNKRRKKVIKKKEEEEEVLANDISEEDHGSHEVSPKNVYNDEKYNSEVLNQRQMVLDNISKYLRPSEVEETITSPSKEDISRDADSDKGPIEENSRDNISTDGYVDSSYMSISSVSLEDSPLSKLQLLDRERFNANFENKEHDSDVDMMDESGNSSYIDKYNSQVLNQRQMVLDNLSKYLRPSEVEETITSPSKRYDDIIPSSIKSRKEKEQIHSPQIQEEQVPNIDRMQNEVEEQRAMVIGNLSQYVNTTKMDVDEDSSSDSDIEIPQDTEFINVNNIQSNVGSEISEENHINVSELNDEDHDMNVCSCHIPRELNYAVELVKSDEVLIPFLKRLYEKDILDDYLLLLQLMSSGALEVDNIPFYLALERAKLQSCESTTGMKYNKKTLDYWTVFYRTCKGAGLNLASGAKHGGHVTGNKCEKGHYDPSTGSFNFAVPDVKTILKHQKRIEKYIMPGIIQSAFPLLNENKQYILEYDGKRLSSGLDKDDIGSINLWGHEGPPSLQDCNLRLNEELDIIKQLSNVDVQYNCHIVRVLFKVIRNLSVRIKEKRYSLLGYEKYRNEVETMSKDNPRIAQKYKLSLGNTKASIYTIKCWIRSALDMNKTICKILSKVNGTQQIFNSTDTVDFSEQLNVRNLFPLEYIQDKFDFDNNTFIVKQRSEKWKALRKSARLTGSTMYTSIGLDTLKREKEHFDEFVSKIEPDPFPKDVQERLNHGTENEINALATLVSIYMPAFSPSCSRYIEDGCNFIHGDKKSNLLEVSTDGILKCRHHVNNVQCGRDLGLEHSDMIIEVKCPYPDEKKVPVAYYPQVRYVSQILCGMKCKNVQKCLFVCYSKESTTFCVCTFDETLWNKMWEIAKKKYDIDKPVKPKCLPENIKEIKDLLKQYTEVNVEFVAELPSVKGIEGSYDNHEVNNPYRCNPPLQVQIEREEDVCNEILDITSKCIEITKEAHELSRKKCSEILAFLLCDSDREKSSKGIDNIPVAYAMKGYSLDNSTMRKMIEEVRDECKEKNIDILCEVSDGQWRNIICNDIHGEPLTRLQFQKKCWNDMMKIRKKDLIQMLLNCSVVEDTTLQYWCNNDQILMVPGSHTMGNITVSCDHFTKRNGSNQRKLSISSAGGTISNVPLMKFIETVSEETNRTIWRGTNTSKETCDIEHSDVMSLLPTDVINYKNDIRNAQETNPDGNNDEDLIMDFDEDDNASIVSQGSTSNENNMLTVILDELRKLNKKEIWSKINTKMLYSYHLCDAEAIASSFIVAELNVINNVFNRFTGQRIFNSSENKSNKVNKVCSKFGDQSLWSNLRNVRRNPKSLKDISFKFVSSGKIPKPVIVACAAKIHWELNIDSWENSSTVPMKVFLHHRNEYFTLFSFPEYSEKRNSLEARTLDPTHMLTNLRAKACKSGFEFFDKKSLLRVSKRNKKLLPRPMVTELPDQQNAELAKKLFSKRVQRVMEKNGDLEEAEFVQLVRQWYKACDERGIHPHERIDRLINMHEFLVKDVDFGTFPPPGAFVKGIPIVTYEGLLQCISTRITLYKLAKNNCYNNRAISTLGIESFFSSLSKADFTMTGCPKATQIHKILPIMMDYNTHKHNPDKIFAMDPRRGAPYPYYNMEKVSHSDMSTHGDDQSDSIFKLHNFDKYVKKTKKRTKFKTTIDGLNDTERGKLTIRGDYYKFNASKLTGMQKLSLPEDMNV